MPYDKDETTDAEASCVDWFNIFTGESCVVLLECIFILLQ